MSDLLKMRSLELQDYITSPVFKEITHRFYERHGIRIVEHIKAMKKVDRSLGVGITFVPKDFRKLTREIEATGEFTHDDRDNTVIERAAALVTDGEGYREIGPVSLHVAISENRVNIHIDDYGFMGVDQHGRTYFNAELFQHIGDDLGVGFIRELFGKNNHWAARAAGWFFQRTHLELSHAQNGYRKGAGASFDIARGRSNDAERRWKLSFNLDYTCKDKWCQERERFLGLNFVVGRIPSDTSNNGGIPRQRR